MPVEWAGGETAGTSPRGAKLRSKMRYKRRYEFVVKQRELPGGAGNEGGRRSSGNCAVTSITTSGEAAGDIRRSGIWATAGAALW